MKPAEIIRRRLANQHLVNSTLQTPAEVVAALGAVQAQDFYGALWALALRLPPTTESQVEEWFAEGRILRTHILRPTWHFVSPADVRWMLSLSAARVHTINAGMYRDLGVDAAARKRALKVFERSLGGSRFLTRQQLAAELEAGGVADAKGRAWPTW